MYFVEGIFFSISIHMYQLFFSSILLRCTWWKVFVFHIIYVRTVPLGFFFSYIMLGFFLSFNDVAPCIFLSYFAFLDLLYISLRFFFLCQWFHQILTSSF